MKLSDLTKTSTATAQLPELSKSSEVMKAISAQQAAIKQLSELKTSSEVMKAISAQQAAIKQLSELKTSSEVMKAISAQQAAIKRLSELKTSSELTKVISAQRAAIKRLSELNKSSELTKAFSARQKIAEQVRASLQLPYMESLAKLTHQDAISKSAVGVTGGALEQAHASVISGSVDRQPFPPLERTLRDASSISIMSARELGRLIRLEREKRKMSQQAFADLVGVGRRFISELKNGKTTLEFDKVLQVASASGLDLVARRRE